MKSILVVAPPSDERAALCTRLEAAGYVIFLASTRAEALSILAQMLPGALYIDLAMPRRQGRLLAEHVCADPRLRMVPRLVALGTWRRNTRPVSAAATFVKPVDPDHVARTLRTVYPPPTTAATPNEIPRGPAPWAAGLESVLAG
jgi:CheY-like chemotaxis protein